jgi:hypothetical protein
VVAVSLPQNPKTPLLLSMDGNNYYTIFKIINDRQLNTKHNHELRRLIAEASFERFHIARLQR